MNEKSSDSVPVLSDTGLKVFDVAGVPAGERTREKETEADREKGREREIERDGPLITTGRTYQRRRVGDTEKDFKRH